MSTKRYFQFLKPAWIILIVGFTVASCTKNDPDTQLSGKVEFTIPGILTTSGARVGEAPMPKSLLISVKGKMNLNKKKVPLYYFDGQFISDPACC